jgi:hypothetical protein
MTTETLAAGTTTWSVPAGVTSVKVTVIGAGGGGGTRTTSGGGGGAGGGGTSITNAVTVTPAATCYCSIPAGRTPAQAAATAWFNKTANSAPTLVADGALANSGVSVPDNTLTRGLGGSTTGAVGDTKYAGGAGFTSAGTDGGGGGSSAGTGAGGVDATSSTGATAPTGGGSGGNGASSANTNGSPGVTPGGGGGGARRSSGTRTGGTGGDARIILEYTSPLGASTAALPSGVGAMGSGLTRAILPAGLGHMG